MIIGFPKLLIWPSIKLMAKYKTSTLGTSNWMKSFLEHSREDY